VWRSPDGENWTQVNADGFGTGGQTSQGINALAVFDGDLYAATEGLPDGVVGAEVWRCQVCDGNDWEKVVVNGFGNPNTYELGGLAVHNDQLYFVVGSQVSGTEVWRSGDGTDWEQVSAGGFGNPNNIGTFLGNSVVNLGGGLYVGTWNEANGGELWLYLR